MLQTLPLVLFIIMTEVSIGSFSVLVLLDWRNEVKRGFLVSYALIYLGLTGLTYLFQQNYSTPELLSTFTQLDKAWIGYQTLPLLLFFVLMIPYNVLLLFDRSAGVQSQQEEENTEAKETRTSKLRLLRLVSGGLTVAAGLATLFVMAMIYRPLASANFGGIFTVAGFFAAAFALGGVMTAMWLGHWYLVTPALSEKPLQFSTTLVLIAILAQILFVATAGPSTIHAATIPAGHTAGHNHLSHSTWRPDQTSRCTRYHTSEYGCHRLDSYSGGIYHAVSAWWIVLETDSRPFIPVCNRNALSRCCLHPCR